MSLFAENSLSKRLSGSPYQGYVYAYPHKTAYRRMEPARSLRGIWSTERRDALFLYVHVPFCGMRCGFCNLFTQANPNDALVPAYLDALHEQAAVARDCLGEAGFVRLAIGGGTPTYLDERQLDRLFDIVERTLGVATQAISSSVEVSPETVTRKKLDLLRCRGVSRVSIGVQSFVDAEVHASGRPQRTEDVHAALTMIREAGFPALNIDLIYGLPGQTVESWLGSVENALRYRPEELYLYPLYVRPLTGLGRTRREWDDVRLECYRAARDRLTGAGYQQASMRMFRRPDTGSDDIPVYCCQDDGMVGIGCGARSYTRSVHYSSEYAVGAAGVREIVRDFVGRPAESFALAEHGFVLDGDEQRRRFVLQSLLQSAGLDDEHYRSRFRTTALDDLPELHELGDHDLAIVEGERIQLTQRGLELSDVIGPWLFSDAVRRLMRGHDAR